MTAFPKRRRVAIGARVRSVLAAGDSGVALPMVLLVFVVGVALISAFLVAITGSFQVTATTKAHVQAQAAAEAGINTVVAAAMSADPCAATGPVTGTDPKFTATFSCNAGKDLLTITSTGTAPNGQSRKVQAVVALQDTSAPPTEGGPGLFYTYGMATRLNGYVFDDVNSEVGIDVFAGSAGVYASTGDINCGAGSVFPSDIYTAVGGLQLDSGCLVQGNAYIGGTAKVNGGTIEGDLLAPKNVNHTITGVIGTTGTATGGNIFTGGTVTVNRGTVHHSVTAAGSGKSTLGSGEIKGNFVYKGSYDTWGGNIVRGTISQNAGITAPTLPPIPGWQDVAFVPDNTSSPSKAWRDAGFKLTTVTSSADCKKWSGNGADVTALASTLTSNMIYDIRACTGGFDTNAGGANKTVSIPSDIAIIANKWYLSGTKFSSSNGEKHTVFLITPDSRPATVGPQCDSPAAKSELLNGTTVDPKIAVYIYTPCEMNFNGGQFRGQVYAGKIAFGGGVKVAFAPRNVPGYDFGEGYNPVGSGGSGSGSGSGATTGSYVDKILSQRNIS